MPHKRDPHFFEALLENAEAAADLLTDNEMVKAIPVVGTAVKLCKGFDDIRSRVLAAKLQAFLTEPHLQTEDARAKIEQKVRGAQKNLRQSAKHSFSYSID